MFIEVKDMEKVFHIPEPWNIAECQFDEKQKQLDVSVKFRKGATFPCCNCGASNQCVHFYVDHALAVQNLSHVTKISTDETSAKRVHNYITIFMDPEQKNVICVTKGKDAATWSE